LTKQFNLTTYLYLDMAPRCNSTTNNSSDSDGFAPPPQPQAKKKKQGLTTKGLTITISTNAMNVGQKPSIKKAEVGKPTLPCLSFTHPWLFRERESHQETQEAEEEEG
jgi:hypothetical protein